MALVENYNNFFHRTPQTHKEGGGGKIAPLTQNVKIIYQKGLKWIFLIYNEVWLVFLIRHM